MASCSKYHNKLFHEENDKIEINGIANSVSDDNSSDDNVVTAIVMDYKTLLKLIPEYINGPNPHCISSGSKVSLTEKIIADRVGLR